MPREITRSLDLVNSFTDEIYTRFDANTINNVYKHISFISFFKYILPDNNTTWCPNRVIASPILKRNRCAYASANITFV